MRYVAVLLAALVAIAGQLADAADWPQFRGPDGQGHSVSRNVPLRWSESENIRWKTPIAGLGWSSPAIRGNQIWVTTAVDDGHSLGAIAIDRDSGKILHDVEIFQIKEPGSVHANNSHASPTPTIDGDRVFLHFGAHGTACISTAGEVLWRNQELKHLTGHGPGGSPVVWKDLVFVNCDGTDVQFVEALDKASGAIRWKRDRQHISKERKSGELQVPMAYCSPMLLEIDGRTQLVSLGSDAIVAYEPATGDEIWWFSYIGYSNVAMPVFGDGRLFFSSGFGEPTFFGMKVGGRGDLTKTNEIWSTTKASLVPLDVSPLLVGDDLLTITDSGVAVSYDAASGKQHWMERMGAKFWASPVYADGRIYCVDDHATTHVLAAGEKFERLATNVLDGAAQASPAIVDGAIFLRTDKFLYRIENENADAAQAH